MNKQLSTLTFRVKKLNVDSRKAIECFKHFGLVSFDDYHLVVYGENTPFIIDALTAAGCLGWPRPQDTRLRTRLRPFRMSFWYEGHSMCYGGKGSRAEPESFLSLTFANGVLRQNDVYELLARLDGSDLEVDASTQSLPEGLKPEEWEEELHSALYW